MQTATAIQARRKFVVTSKALDYVVDASAALFLGTFSGVSFWIGALFIADASLAGVLLGIACMFGGVMFAAMAMQSIIEMFN